jgi:hypothetical protein
MGARVETATVAVQSFGWIRIWLHANAVIAIRLEPTDLPVPP